jgi:hypothetical protein
MAKKRIKKSVHLRKTVTAKALGATPKVNVIKLGPEPDYAAAGKHLADAVSSLFKAIEAAKPEPKAFHASWTAL